MSSKIKWLIAITIILNISLVAICLILMKSQHYNDLPQTYKLGKAEQSGYIGVELTYDKEPVDIELISPTGKRFGKQHTNVYNIDTNKKQMTVLCDTTELGEWTISFNKKTNKHISYVFINKPSPTLNITDVNIVKIKDYYYVKFTPVMETGTIVTCKYSITLTSTQHSFTLDDGNVKLNETAYILFNPNPLAYNGELYDIKIALQTQDEKQSVTKSIQIRLEDKFSK